MANKGSLCAKEFPYRNVTMTSAEYLGIVDNLIKKCNETISKEIKLKDPKKYFDDAVIKVCIRKGDNDKADS